MNANQPRFVVVLAQPRPAFFSRAACIGIDPDMFFPERGASLREAKAVCAGCVVRQECLEYALANAEKCGVWGGMSERQRRHLRQARRVA
jgi:WhiB family transcriptional regulator, redox-sensing transcriptional regulator